MKPELKSEVPEHYKSKTLNQAVAHLNEECGEVVAACGKSFRFGLDSYNPELPVEDQETNLEWIRREVKDLELAISTFKMILDHMSYGRS